MTEALLACIIIGAVSLKFKFVNLSGFVAAFVIGVMIFAMRALRSDSSIVIQLTYLLTQFALAEHIIS